jgi:hypothetical protein
MGSEGFALQEGRRVRTQALALPRCSLNLRYMQYTVSQVDDTIEHKEGTGTEGLANRVTSQG